jgi:shikimate dehydrogenase
VIKGSTEIIPIIGHPVSQVFSPPVFNAAFARDGLDCAMIPLDVPPHALDAFWAILRASPNMAGCSVTYPHKRAAFDAVDRHTPRVARLGALNTVRFEDGQLLGDATDGVAMCAAIVAAGEKITGRSAVIVGAGGGAGIAIVDALCENGIRSLSLIETHDERLKALKSFMKVNWADVDVGFAIRPSDIAINATTLGKSEGDDCPFEDDVLAGAKIVCDVVTSPTGTQLGCAATAFNLPFVSGEDMGRCQLAAQRGFWRR